MWRNRESSMNRHHSHKSKGKNRLLSNPPRNEDTSHASHPHLASSWSCRVSSNNKKRHTSTTTTAAAAMILWMSAGPGFGSVYAFGGLQSQQSQKDKTNHNKNNKHCSELTTYHPHRPRRNSNRNNNNHRNQWSMLPLSKSPLYHHPINSNHHHPRTLTQRTITSRQQRWDTIQSTSKASSSSTTDTATASTAVDSCSSSSSTSSSSVTSFPSEQEEKQVSSLLQHPTLPSDDDDASDSHRNEQCKHPFQNRPPSHNTDLNTDDNDKHNNDNKGQSFELLMALQILRQTQQEYKQQQEQEHDNKDPEILPHDHLRITKFEYRNHSFINGLNDDDSLFTNSFMENEYQFITKNMLVDDHDQLDEDMNDDDDDENDENHGDGEEIYTPSIDSHATRESSSNVLLQRRRMILHSLLVSPMVAASSAAYPVSSSSSSSITTTTTATSSSPTDIVFSTSKNVLSGKAIPPTLNMIEEGAEEEAIEKEETNSKDESFLPIRQASRITIQKSSTLTSNQNTYVSPLNNLIIRPFKTTRLQQSSSPSSSSTTSSNPKQPITYFSKQDLLGTVLWSTALWLLAGSRSNPLVKPLANALYSNKNIEKQEQEQQLGQGEDQVSARNNEKLSSSVQQVASLTSTTNITSATFTSRSSSISLSEPTDNNIKISMEDDLSWIQDRNDGLFTPLPPSFLFLLGVIFLILGLFTERAILFLAEGDTDITLQLAGVTLIGGASVELGRIASGEKLQTRQEVDRSDQLLTEFQNFAQKRLIFGQGGSVHRSEVIRAFRRYYTKYRTEDDTVLSDLEIEKLARYWNKNIVKNSEGMSSAGFFKNIKINTQTEIR